MLIIQNQTKSPTMHIKISQQSCLKPVFKLSYSQNIEKRYFGHMMTLDDYIKGLTARGRAYFTAQQAINELGISPAALHSRVHRLKLKGEIASPAKNLFVPISAEYHQMGCIPAADLAVILMRYLDQEYYVGLLSAAMYHGASHQKPQIFQVVVNKQIPALHIGTVSIEFIFKKDIHNLPSNTITVKSGYMNISSPEVTAMDLMLYPHRIGGINAIATILSELIETLDPDKLISLAKAQHAKSWAQRLGWILDQIDTLDNEKKELLLIKLLSFLKNQKLYFIPATPELSIAGCNRNKKWKIIENTTVESDYDS